MKATVRLGVFSAANLVLSMLFQWFVVASLGAGEMSDALFAALTVPQIFVTVIAISLINVLTPLLAGEDELDQRVDAWTILIGGTLLFGLLAVALTFAAPFWVPLTVPGFDASAVSLTIRLTQISLLGIVFTGATSIQTGLAYARGRYTYVEVIGAATNALAIVLLVWTLPRHGVEAAAWVTVLRLAIQCILLFHGFPRPTLPRFRSATMREVRARMRPLVVGASYYKMDPLVDRFLLSAAVPGSLSLIYIAQQLHGAGSQLLAKSIVTPAITRLALAFKRRDEGEYWRIEKRTMRLLLALSLGALALLAVAGLPLANALAEERVMASVDLPRLWQYALLSGFMLIAGACGSLTAGSFYARGDTKSPTIIGSIAFTAGIAIKVLMFQQFDAAGLAVGISLYYGLSLLMQWLWLHYRVRRPVRTSSSSSIDPETAVGTGL